MDDVTIPQDWIDLVERARLGFVATVTPRGEPHVSPKGTTWILDGGRQVGFAHIHSHRTIGNLENDPAMVMCAVDVFQRRGLVVRGRAHVHGFGSEVYDRLAEELARRRGSVPAGVHAFVVSEVVAWEPVLSPAYDDGADVSVVESRWRDFYGSQAPRSQGS